MFVRRSVLVLLASLATVGAMTPVASAATAPSVSGSPQSITADNRAGYAVSPEQVHRIAASWIQPQATCGAKATYTTFQVSTQGASSPFRVGTALECHGGRAVSYAFVGGPGGKVSESVEPGDRVSASIQVQSHGISYSIENDTKGWGVGGGSAGSGPGPKYSTAAVLVQARTNSAGQVLPVTRFSPVTFRLCHVNSQLIGLQHPRRIVMHTPNGGLARPSGLVDHQQFTVTRPGS